jgi:Glycosyl transferase family 2
VEKYTVIIPVKNGAETIEHTIRTCLRQTYPNFEIVVSDNCSDDGTRQVVERIADRRIRYINPGRRLSMSGNFEYSLAHAGEGYVMFIGADDGVMPGAIERVSQIAIQTGAKAIASRMATYVWPNFPDPKIRGRLQFAWRRDGVEVRRSEEWLQRALDFDDLYVFELPSVYCGFVHTDVIEKARKDGKYFRSITPDAYSAFATATTVDRYAFSLAPFVIAGASAKSNGASNLNAKGDNAVGAEFEVENDIPFHPGFVSCPSYDVITAEAFAQVADAFPDRCAAWQVNIPRMLGLSLASTNEKTAGSVRQAVAKMAETHGLSEANYLRHKHRRARLGSPQLSALANVMLSPKTKYVGMADSTKFHVANVDDAALAASLLIEINRGREMETSRGQTVRAIGSRLRRVLGFGSGELLK